MSTTVIQALRRFLPAYRAGKPPLDHAKRRAIWALSHCRSAEMGGHVHVCPSCKKKEFHFHSCNHRSCPQCGSMGNAKWVKRELDKRVGAPYFMVTFTLPSALRGHFHGPEAKEVYDLFFRAASGALADILANPKWLGATKSGFTMVLHTWNQQMGFHPHIHAIVPGAGCDKHGRVVTVKNPNFLIPQKALRSVYRARFRDLLKESTLSEKLKNVDQGVWKLSWGVDLQPFGSGGNAIRYLGAYVCRSVIGNSRITSIKNDRVSFNWKDRANGGITRNATIAGTEFVARYLRHVLPKGLRSIRYYGFCHPAAKARRERIAFHTGRPLEVGPPPPEPKPSVRKCFHCGTPTQRFETIKARWKSARDPPKKLAKCA
jgi:hypothetical protein